jgi:hypothetical protein
MSWRTFINLAVGFLLSQWLWDHVIGKAVK